MKIIEYFIDHHIDNSKEYLFKFYMNFNGKVIENLHSFKLYAYGDYESFKNATIKNIEMSSYFLDNPCIIFFTSRNKSRYEYLTINDFVRADNIFNKEFKEIRNDVLKSNVKKFLEAL